MARARITIQSSIPAAAQPGDYALLCGNRGQGAIDWVNPLTGERLALFPDGAGSYGWYHGPWYHFPWYRAETSLTPGWYHSPWYHFPWYHGGCTLKTQITVKTCGEYLFAFKGLDQLGNLHQGTPEEVPMIVHMAPDAPRRLKPYSYNKDTDVLILAAMD